MTANELLGRLEQVRPNGRDSWMACCPAHADSDPSLAVKAKEDGRLLVHCFAGCTPAEVMGALDLSLSDLFEKPLYHRAGPAGHDNGARLRNTDYAMRVIDTYRATGRILHRDVWAGWAATLIELAQLAPQNLTREDRALVRQVANDLRTEK